VFWPHNFGFFSLDVEEADDIGVVALLLDSDSPVGSPQLDERHPAIVFGEGLEKFERIEEKDLEGDFFAKDDVVYI
jgi:hypothetical protein